MLPFKCVKCSHYSFSAGIANCFHCGSDATANAAFGDTFLITQPQIESSKDNNEASGSRNPLVQTDMQTVNVYNSNRNESNKRMIAEEKEAHKETRQKLWGKSDPILLPFCKPDSKNRDLVPETIAAKSQMVSDNSRSIDMHRQFLNNEIVETLSNNQGMHSPDDIAKSSLFPMSQSNASSIGTLQSDNGSRKIPNTEVSTLKRRYLDDSHAVPGASGLHRNRKDSNKSLDELKSRNPQETLCVQPGDEKEFICPVCDDKTVKHANTENRGIFYNCCVCVYKTDKKIDLKMHSHIHCARKICNICEKEYAEGNDHESEHRCSLCEKIFQCRSELDEHFLNHHLDNFSSHCWVCSRSIDYHIAQEESHILYVCCLCGCRDRDMRNFKKHNKTHRPKFFCKHCKEEYPGGEKSYHNKELTCIVCDKKFQCKGLLEDHSRHHEKNFSTYCRVCKVEISKHEMKDGDLSFYNCCLCKSPFNQKMSFKTHLYTHTDLRLFKCDVCGRRFKQNQGLNKHLLTCIPLPYKCKKCRARFPNNGSLALHRSKKHTKIRDEIQD